MDWLSVSGRVRVDNSDSRYTRKLYATSNEILVENSKNGLYGISQTNDKQTYADFMVNINKTFKEVEKELETDLEKGLSKEKVKQKQEKYGFNALMEDLKLYERDKG